MMQFRGFERKNFPTVRVAVAGGRCAGVKSILARRRGDEVRARPCGRACGRCQERQPAGMRFKVGCPRFGFGFGSSLLRYPPVHWGL